ncbi:X-linked retinitis pigmentosa GTPase regulator-interacting protein 1 [Bombina bombina]|uniref:X-linked retinitis pigmentosa GTPase regulator-interacting protein 1 n=1 Tax=Bombina bombina TaxID=8345 RepID=UPI00235A7905|nr:X-linked retinitis pigmentosa GTPase regulator-interacting protein 1 [Bombina bombina]
MSFRLVDETSSDLPVKDTDCKPTVIKAIQEKELKIRRRVSLISREELEDNFLQLHEENLLLKEHARKQEDKIKRMGTKLLRLTSELGQTGEKKTGETRRDGRDLEIEETIEDLQDRVRDLERRNEALRHRLTTYKQRLQVQDGCRHCPYSTVIARTDSGIRRNVTLPDKTRRGLRLQGPEIKSVRTATEVYGEPLSHEARAEIDRLVHVIESQNCKVDDLERSTILLKNMVAMKSKDIGQDMVLSLHHLQKTEDQRNVIQDNVMQIRMQKELREKSTQLCALREQFQQLKESYETELQEKHKSLTLSHGAVLNQLEDLSAQLKEERAKVVAMETQQQSALSLQRSLLESKERVGDLEKEKELLKENYDNLLKSSLDSDHLNSFKATEKEMLEKNSQLESQLSSHLSKMMQNTEQLQYEREQNEYLKKEVSRLQTHLLEKIEEVHELQTKVSAILFSKTVKVQGEEEMTIQQTQDANCEMCQELRKLNKNEEKNKRRENEKRTQYLYEEGGRQRENSDKMREEEEQMSKEDEKQRQRKIHDIEAAHAETIHELEKTREMLNLQHKINKDYQDELQTLSGRAESERREREESEKHYEARLLQRNSRIQILEAQLKDIAYGTYLPKGMAEEDPLDMEISPTPTLHRGETLFEINIGGLCFTPYGLRVTEDPQPTTFCIYSLYDFEMHATPVVTGERPQYNFTSQYAVTPDPDFLRYLRVGCLTVELYQAVGGKHQELARGRLKLEAALQTTNKVHGTFILTDTHGQDIGEIDYWLRLHGPFSQSKQMQRTKARSYLSTHRPRHAKFSASPFLDEPQNELIIRVWGCRGLRVEQLGYQPSPYAMYCFYHHPDHATNIIPCSNNPQFGDEFSYCLKLSTDLERYLQGEQLYIYVFDDENTQPGSYIGRAKVPLQRLAEGKNIQGDFALLDPYSKCSGSMQVSLEWKYPYQAKCQSLWDSNTLGHSIPEKLHDISLPQPHSQAHLLPRDAPHINSSALKRSKSCKTDEDSRVHVSSSKRGRRDTHSKTSQRTVSEPSRHKHLTDEQPREESDMDMKEITEREKLHLYSQKRNQEMDTVENESTDVSESQNSDSDDIIIVAKSRVPHKLPSSQIRVEVASLSLDPCSDVVANSEIQRVFVEFRFLGVPLEETETPISLRKPRRGEEIYYHFSKVIHLDGEENEERRKFLYTLLEGSNDSGERVRLKFTIVSDPINEEDECQDMGYAYLDLGALLRRAGDPAEETLHSEYS